jgi:predicted nuclease of predicted toxin-antitoxin system
MRFLVDECSGPGLAKWLREQQHDVFSVYDEARGLTDSKVLEKAHMEDRILITLDKGFGERAFRQKEPHKGIILLRLDDERTSNKIAAMARLLADHADRLANRFAVVTESTIRIVGVVTPENDTP